jgi:hypothetical protein
MLYEKPRSRHGIVYRTFQEAMAAPGDGIIVPYNGPCEVYTEEQGYKVIWIEGYRIEERG